MEQLIKRSYESIKARGLIEKDTPRASFEAKILEEFTELMEAFIFNDSIAIRNESTDLINTLLNFQYHHGIDSEKELIKCIEKQEKRAKDNKF